MKQTKFLKFRFGTRKPTVSKRVGKYFEKLQTNVKKK